MSAVAICTDSSALFPEGVAERLGVTVVPIAITVGGRMFDEHETPIDDFYTRMSAGEQVTTSQPSPGEFLAAYATLAAGGAAEVLSIHLDARVSGTAGAAALAAGEAPIPVTVVDTQTVSFGVGLCVRAAAQALNAGASVHDAASLAAAVGTRQHKVFVAHQGPPGRLPAVAGWAVLEFADGAARPVDVRDNIGEAIDAMTAGILAEELPVRAAVGHAGAATEPAADALALSLAGLSQVVEVERYRVGAAVGAHTGPRSFGAFWWPAQ
jgi:fatty acid kinase fatty acid binding subunit